MVNDHQFPREAREEAAKPKRPSFVLDLMSYEQGQMDLDDVIPFFQALVNSGMLCQLKHSYTKTAQRLVDAGLITAKGE